MKLPGPARSRRGGGTTRERRGTKRNQGSGRAREGLGERGLKLRGSVRPLGIVRPTLAILLAGTLGTSPAGATAALTQLPTAFVNVNVVPMDSERVLPAHTIVVQDGRIVAMGPRARTPVPGRARIIDGRGAYLLPGLADMHVHFLADSNELLLYVANGVTTVRDLSGEPVYFGWRRDITEGRRVGPNILVGSPVIEAPPGQRRAMAWLWGMTLAVAGVLLAVAWPAVRRIRRPGVRRWLVPAGVAAAIVAGSLITRTFLPFPDALLPSGQVPHWWVGSPREAAASVRAAAERYDAVKLYERLPPATFAAAVRAAREAGIHTVAHVPASMGLERTLHSGVDELAHVYFLVEALQASTDTASLRTAELRDNAYRRRLHEIVADVRSSGVNVTSTLMPLPEVLEQETDSAVFLARDDMRYRTPAARRAARERMRGAAPSVGYDLRAHITWGSIAARELVRAGVPLVLGTDDSPMTAVAGFSAHEELKLLVGSGLWPYEALRTATVNASRVAGGTARWGTIAVGARADLLLAGGNPLADIGAVRRPRGVMVAGRWYDRAVLDSVLEAVARRRAGS